MKQILVLSWIAGTGHKLDGLRGGQTLGELLMDLHNNAVWRDAEKNSTPVTQGKLWTLPLNGSSYNTYQGAR